jgi:biopolymer transport protein ExbD
MRLETGYDDRRARIELIPLMDVLFFLLVFLIYTMLTMTTHRGVRVDLPRAAGAAEVGRRMIITVLADDHLQLDGRAMESDDLVVTVAGRWRAGRTPVLISADRTAHLGTGIELLGRLKRAGVEAVAFQVRAAEAAPGRAPGK